MTLIGNRNSLAFELVPVKPSWELRYGPERAAWAGTGIWVGGRNLCLHVKPGSATIDDYLFIPLGPIVDWLLRSFAAIEFEEGASVFPTTRSPHEDVRRWSIAPHPAAVDELQWHDLRDEWWERHFLSAGADGARLPNLALLRDDEQLVLAWAPPSFPETLPPTLINEQGVFALPWQEGRQVVADLAAQVAQWFREAGATDVYPWAHQVNPLHDRSASLTDALIFFTRRSIPQLTELFGVESASVAPADATAVLEVPHELLNVLGLLHTSTDPGTSTQCQILRDLSPTVDAEVAAVVNEVGRAAADHDPVGVPQWHGGRSVALDAARAAETPHDAGYMAAAEIRRYMGLDGTPIGDIPALLSQFELSYRHAEGVAGGSDRMIVGLHESGMAAAVTLRTARTAQRWGQRFEACRALGHVLLDPIRAGAMGAASGAYARETSRRRSGAFAAELLVPESALERASGGQLDGATHGPAFERLMEEYGVGARTVAHHLFNRGWLSTPEVRDDLIDQFARLG